MNFNSQFQKLSISIPFSTGWKPYFLGSVKSEALDARPLVENEERTPKLENEAPSINQSIKNFISLRILDSSMLISPTKIS